MNHRPDAIHTWMRADVTVENVVSRQLSLSKIRCKKIRRPCSNEPKRIQAWHFFISDLPLRQEIEFETRYCNPITSPGSEIQQYSQAMPGMHVWHFSSLDSHTTTTDKIA